jgi:hypothetical protein
MKNYLFMALGLLPFSEINAQLKATAACPPFTVDVMSGTVNELQPKSAIVEIQATLPCSTGMVEKDISGACAGVFYKDRDIHFFTDRKYIEIGEKFKGKITPALMGVSRKNLFSLLGHPKLKDAHWEAYQMGYGTLVLYYNAAGKINKIQMASKTAEALKLCE